MALHTGGRRLESSTNHPRRPKSSIHATPYSQFRRQSQGVMQGLLAAMALVVRGRAETRSVGKDGSTLGRRLERQYSELEADMRCHLASRRRGNSRQIKTFGAAPGRGAGSG